MYNTTLAPPKTGPPTSTQPGQILFVHLFLPQGLWFETEKLKKCKPLICFFCMVVSGFLKHSSKEVILEASFSLEKNPMFL